VRRYVESQVTTNPAPSADSLVTGDYRICRVGCAPVPRSDRRWNVVRVRDAGLMSDGTNISWDEIDRSAAALVVWATRWSLPLNPEDCEAIAASVIGASRSNASRDEIYALTEAAIASHERAIEGLYRRGPSSLHDRDRRSEPDWNSWRLRTLEGVGSWNRSTRRRGGIRLS
jgi:hypothetical protein